MNTDKIPRLHLIAALYLLFMLGVLIGIGVVLFVERFTRMNFAFDTIFILLLCSILILACGLLIWAWGVLSHHHIRRFGDKSDLS